MKNMALWGKKGDIDVILGNSGKVIWKVKTTVNHI